MYSNEELKVLTNLAEKIYGRDFDSLDYDEQDDIYCYAADNGLI